MQSAVSLKPRLDAHKSPVNVIAPSQERTNSSMPDAITNKDINKEFEEENQIELLGAFSKAKKISRSHAEKTVLLKEEHAKVNHYLSTIEDPLWKHVCHEVIEMMGPASFLKIWRSNLGPLSSQNTVLDITCETEETAAFIQQYDFVILGSLQGYFPVLKKIKAKKQ